MGLTPGLSRPLHISESPPFASIPVGGGGEWSARRRGWWRSRAPAKPTGRAAAAGPVSYCSRAHQVAAPEPVYLFRPVKCVELLQFLGKGFERVGCGNDNNDDGVHDVEKQHQICIPIAWIRVPIVWTRVTAAGSMLP
ncbi:hypothetical protein GUJ93_ZPchr0007g4263 [Zizania palustris]|uniref:Uncharacterized protein n=1 Tax=Zizania palustris TaxID=103762 RepID=A0A8J5T5V1_ZIZPA|nr:hypothetical protein GUJ93_ZPchr0007g4263 [Zizania palustris]